VDIQLPYRPTSGFDGLFGLEIVELSDELAVGHLAVREELKQPFGLLHGGVYAGMAETLASLATGVAVSRDGRVAMGLSNQTSFLRAITEGVVHGRAIRKHGGRSTWVWEVEFTDDAGRLCALCRMTVAVREPRPAGG
jgi:1,4-dihydroxy-2-naphthoyl-CoA hydrolase